MGKTIVLGDPVCVSLFFIAQCGMTNLDQVKLS